MIDPVFCLQDLARYEPEATINITMRSIDTEPRTRLIASMRNTGSAVTKGDGAWVRYNDVLSFMILLKRQESDLRVAVSKATGEK